MSAVSDVKKHHVHGLRHARASIVDLRRRLQEQGMMQNLTADEALQKAVDVISDTIGIAKQIS